MSKTFIFVGIGLIILALAVMFILTRGKPPASQGLQGQEDLLVDFHYAPISPLSDQFKYLAFQIFTPAKGSSFAEKNLASSRESLDAQVKNIAESIGTTGSENRMLAFMVGPLSFDHSDNEVRNLINLSFQTAEKYAIAVGFHIDDSMFWRNYNPLNHHENIEWIDWNKTPNTGRRLEWSQTPTKISPQLCFNSPGVREAVQNRARLIGTEIARHIAALREKEKEYLFAGVIAGWETQIGKDFDTDSYLGYCALANKGFSSSSRIDGDRERETIVQEFINAWTKALSENGIPKQKLYSHIAFQPEGLYHLNEKNMKADGTIRTYSEYVSFSTPRTAFGAYHNPGFSTYPAAGIMDAIYGELAKNGNPPWASSEGTALDPSQAESGAGGIDMESYLGSFYNHGATLVTIFGWGVGDKNFPFRKVAESNQAINTYRAFIATGKLTVKEGVIQGGVSADFANKIKKFQAVVPPYVQQDPANQKKIAPIVSLFESALKKGRLHEAEGYLDEILKIIEK